MTGRVLVLSLLLAVVYSESERVTLTTPSSPTSGNPPPACQCINCEIYEPNYQKHIQKHYCDSAAVIQGRITDSKENLENAGIWNTDTHHQAITAYYAPVQHYELSVRVLDVHYSNNKTKIERLEKIVIRYPWQLGCDKPCGPLVENFEDEDFNDRALKVGEKYVFFLPGLFGGFGDRQEAVMEQCTRVWRWSKEGNDVPGYIPRLYRHVLTKTKCEKCRVSGCYQDKCVHKSDVEQLQCDELFVGRTEFAAHVCQPLMDDGFCYYNPAHDSCRWISFNKDGVRSKKPIEECLLEEPKE